MGVPIFFFLGGGEYSTLFDGRTTEDRQTAGFFIAFLCLHMAEYATLECHTATLSMNESTFARRKVASASKEATSARQQGTSAISANSLRHPSNNSTRQES